MQGFLTSLAGGMVKMPAVKDAEMVGRRTIDVFLDRVRKKQPVHPHVTDAVLTISGISRDDFACLTPLEQELILLHSLAVRKYELSSESGGGYVTWGESYHIWSQEGYPEALERRISVVPLISQEIRRLPSGEKSAYQSSYMQYLLWLREMTGHDNDPIPEEVLLLAVRKYEFPEIPSEKRDEAGMRYLSSQSLSALCREAERRAS
jgi:hypothetical protein